MSTKCFRLFIFGLAAANAFQSRVDVPSDKLAEGFSHPPQEAKPRVWWHWIDGNVSAAGAKLDLAWMRRVGVGGIHAFSGGGFFEPPVVNPLVPFMSPEWQNVFRISTQMAHAAGMEVTIAGSPGWSETGGRWVTPEHAMKKYVWSETQIEGGRPFTGILQQPPSVTGPFMALKASYRMAPPANLTHDVYVDSAVVAFPSTEEVSASKASYTTGPENVDLSTLKNDLSVRVQLPVTNGERSAWVQASFEQPTTISALVLGLIGTAGIEVQASQDGHEFRTVMQAPPDLSENPTPEQTYAFAPTRAQFFRVILTAPPQAAPFPGLPKQYAAFMLRPFKAFMLTRFTLVPDSRVNRFESKAGFNSTVDFSAFPTPEPPPNSVIKQSEVIDLTSKLDPQGHLNWTPPPGHWTVLRIGYSLTGQTNGPAEAAATGLEVDKLDSAMVREYLEHYLSLYSDKTGVALGSKGIENLLTDSWEAGIQNWTPSMLAQFHSRRGYDPVPFLPVLTGRVVNNAETSDRFLWDFRRTLKEMLAENHYGTLAKVLHEHGMSYYTEAQGDTPRAIGDGFAMKARADIPTGEYWYRPFAAGPGQPTLKADLEEAASVAHIYGKRFAASESLTVAAGDDPWSFSPAMLKPVVDEIFAHGINRILIHESHHQPLLDKKPGLEMAFFGQFFNRNDTWAEYAEPWVSYLARSSYMLQQGRYVADVLYFYGEDQNLTELFTGKFNTDVPEGFHYDYIDAEALLTLLSVKDGRLVTPSGMSYRVLFLPAHVTRFTLPTIHKLRDLVAAGAVLLGPKPEGGLGVAASDQAVKAVADEVWGAAGGSPAGHAYGKGRVYIGEDLSRVFALERIQPDIYFQRQQPDTNIMTLHRRTADADIYFVANQKKRPESLDMRFRVSGKAPQIWRAETGAIERVSYRATGESVTVPMRLSENEAVFVVFRKPATRRSWTAPAIKTKSLATLDGPWNLKFESDRGAPASAEFNSLMSWSDSSDPGIKFYSGTVSYSKTVQASAAWFAKGQHVVLDLGEVHELAQVTVNGNNPGSITWHPPYTVDLTTALHPGANTLEIQVTNLWVNRLIGDSRPGAQKIAFAPQSPYTPNSPLLPSGLLGPVRILAVASN